MQKSKSVFSALLIGSLLSSTLALAEGGGTGKFMHFFDSNKDGIVTLDEFEAAMKTRFERMDSDHNNVVSKEEFRSYLKQRRAEHKQRRLQTMDANGDGQISKDEFIKYQTSKLERHFTRLDKNHDGLLSVAELDSGHRHHRHHGKHLFYKLDANGDGVITQEESRAAWSSWFVRLDSNKDNVVSGDEVRAFREQRHTK
jgi:Ca2+-binding EF-hand superfamily protein